MSVAQPAPALTAAEQHKEQREEESAAAATAGDEKSALSKVDATSSRTTSNTASDGTISANDGGIQQRKWYRRLNPLRLRKIPPVPQERTVSREYGASILSVITFQWMSPLMNVSIPKNCH